MKGHKLMIKWGRTRKKKLLTPNFVIGSIIRKYHVFISHAFVLMSIGHVFQELPHIQNTYYLVCKDWLRDSHATCKIWRCQMVRHYQNPHLNFDISYWIAPKPIPNAISEVPYQNFNISHQSFWNWYQEIEIKILISPRIPHFSCNSSSQLQVFLESSSVVPRDCKGTHGLSSSYSLTCVGDESKENRGLSKRRGFEENKIAVRGSAGKVSIILRYNFSFLSLSVLNILSWLKFFFFFIE